MFNKGPKSDSTAAEVVAELTPLLQNIKGGVEEIRKLLDADSEPSGEVHVSVPERASQLEAEGIEQHSGETLEASVNQLGQPEALDAGAGDDALRAELERSKTALDTKERELQEKERELQDAINAREQWAEKCNNELAEYNQAKQEQQNTIDEFASEALQAKQLQHALGIELESLKEVTTKLRNDLEVAIAGGNQASQELQSANQKLTEYSSQLEEASRLIAEKEAQIAERDGVINSLTDEKNELNAQHKKLQDQLHADEKLEVLMWPNFLSEPQMQPWREKLQQEIMQDEVDDNVVLLVACLFNYNAAVRMGKEWQKRLIDVLYDFSAAFFKWCSVNNLPTEQAIEDGRHWAAAFNTSCQGVLDISIPEPDTPYDKRSMVDYQGGGAGSSLDVHSVRSWCIRDENGRIMKQAEVTTQ